MTFFFVAILLIVLLLLIEVPVGSAFGAVRWRVHWGKTHPRSGSKKVPSRRLSATIWTKHTPVLR